MKGGSILISVHTEDSAQRARAEETFERDKAEGISTTGGAHAN